MVLKVNFFHIFEIIMFFCFVVVGICEIADDVEDISPSLTANSI